MADQGKEQKYQKQRAFIEQLQKKNILVTVSSFKRCLQISEPKTSWLMCAYASFRGFPMRKRCSMASELPLRCWKTTSICSKCQTPVTPPDMWTGNTPRLPGNTYSSDPTPPDAVISPRCVLCRFSFTFGCCRCLPAPQPGKAQHTFSLYVKRWMRTKLHKQRASCSIRLLGGTVQPDLPHVSPLPFQNPISPFHRSSDFPQLRRWVWFLHFNPLLSTSQGNRTTAHPHRKRAERCKHVVFFWQRIWMNCWQRMCLKPGSASMRWVTLRMTADTRSVRKCCAGAR